MSRIFLNGAEIEVPERRFLGGALVERFGTASVLAETEAGGRGAPASEDPPYLFCGNGACRDCNLLVDGLSDIPSCRVPLAAGMSIRTVPGNALSRRLPRPPAGEPLTTDLVVVGGGLAGRAVANAVVLEARAPEPRPAGVLSGRLVVYDQGRERSVEARVVVLATGARDVVPPRADVLPMDLIERYVDRGEDALPAPLAPQSGRVILVGEESRVERLRARLLSRGAAADDVAVETKLAPGNEGEGVFVVGHRREPSLEIARALGCQTRYDRRLGMDVLVLSAEGETTVPGVFAAGDVTMRQRESGGESHDAS